MAKTSKRVIFLYVVCALTVLIIFALALTSGCSKCNKEHFSTTASSQSATPVTKTLPDPDPNKNWIYHTVGTNTYVDGDLMELKSGKHSPIDLSKYTKAVLSMKPGAKITFTSSSKTNVSPGFFSNPDHLVSDLSQSFDASQFDTVLVESQTPYMVIKNVEIPSTWGQADATYAGSNKKLEDCEKDFVNKDWTYMTVHNTDKDKVTCTPYKMAMSNQGSDQDIFDVYFSSTKSHYFPQTSAVITGSNVTVNSSSNCFDKVNQNYPVAFYSKTKTGNHCTLANFASSSNTSLYLKKGV